MKKLLIALLSGFMAIGNISLIHAEEISSDAEETVLESYELDPDSLHVRKLGETGKEDAVVEEDSLPHKLNDIVRISIVLNDAATLDAGYSAQGYSSNQEAQNYRNQLESKQHALTKEIEAATGEALDVKWNLTLTVNIISANVKYGDISKIRRISGVKDVFIENRYEAQEDEINTSNTSTYMVGATDAWADGYTGAGRRIAIIDTGIDVDHQSFNADAYLHAINELGKDVDYIADSSELHTLIAGKNLNGSGIFKSAKLPYIYNYVDGNTNVTHLNDTEGEHGSHVAGIAAANKYIKSGSDFVDAASSVKAVGMAPDAQLFIMKVFGAGGGANDSDYMAAIEDAILMECDTVNLSLGSGSPGFTYDTVYQDTLNRLSENGVNLIATISAGNTGGLTDALSTDLYIDDIYMHTGGSPGTFMNSLGVASADNIGNTGTPLKFNNSLDVYYTDGGGDVEVPLMSSIAGSYSYVYIDAVGESADYTAVNGVVSLNGKIVIVNRGSISFFEKGNNAIDFNPKAVIVANNESGTISMDLSDFTGGFPMASITLSDALKIKDGSVKGTTGSYTYYTGSVTVTTQTQTGTTTSRENAIISDFSSWGVPGSLIMKPEITAPGGNIYSVWGTNKKASGTAGGTDKYELMSGTSMAAPHMAGLGAVLAQRLEEEGIVLEGYSRRAIAQSLLMSTATPMKTDDEYISVLRQGSGLAEVSRAVRAKTIIMMGQNDNTLTAKTGSAADGKVKAELGDLPSRNGNYKYSFTVNNISDNGIEYKLKTDLFTQGRYEESGGIFMDRATSMAAMSGWKVVHAWDDSESESHDVNMDGITDDADVQAILDYVVYTAAGRQPEETDTEAADLDGNAKVTSDDAYLLIEWLKADHPQDSDELLYVPAGESRNVTVTIIPDDSLDTAYPSGAYVEGFTYVIPMSVTSEGIKTDPTEYSIPILGFYGNWTDPSMFDNTSYTDTLYGTEKIPYSGNTITNYMTVEYNGTAAKFSGNPYMAEEEFPYDRLALNGNSQIDSIHYSLLRSAGTTGFAVAKTDGYGGNVTDILASSVVSNEVLGLWYYANQAAWQNTGVRFYNWRKTPASLGLAEGDTFRAGFYAVPEYNAMLYNGNMSEGTAGLLDDTGFKDVLLQNVLGKGSYVGYDFTIDNTAPRIGEAVLNGNIITVSAEDNQNLAYVAVLSLNGDVVYAENAPGESSYEISFDGTDAIANATGYVAVFAGDYAGNETAKALKVNDNAYEEKTVYVQTNTLSAGNEYLIVNTKSIGTGYALGHSSAAIATNAVRVNSAIEGTDGAVYIDSADAAETSIWTAASGYTFKNDDYYIRRNGNSNAALQISTNNSNNTWNWNKTNNQLSITVNNRAYYLRYANNTFSINTTANSVYLYKKTIIRNAVDPYGASSVTVTPERLDLYKGNETDLVAKVLPLTAEDRTVSWNSSNTSVATVDSHGHVIATGAGTATITAAANSDESKKAEVEVNVLTVNKNINGIVWDEDGGVYFSSFNASTLPDYSKLHNESKGVDLASAFMANASTLYAGTLDTGSAETVLYSVNRNNYNLTEYGTNYVWANDMTRASSQYTGYFVYSFAKYLIFGNLAPEDYEDGTYSGLPYGLLDISSTSGDGIYVAGVAAKSVSSASSTFYFLDENGKIWQTTMTIGSSVSFGTPTLVIDTGISTSFLYQNLYYDGTYLYWSHYADNVTELIIINPSTGIVYHAGNFGEGVWPVGGLYVNGSAAPASEEEINEEQLPFTPEKMITRDELLSEEVKSRFVAEAGRQTSGSLNSIRNKEAKKRESRTVEKLVRTKKEVKADTEENNGTVTVTLSEDEANHNGLYKVTYDASKLELLSSETNAEYKSIYEDTENGAVYLAYADEKAFAAEETIGTLTFKEPVGTAKVTVIPLENTDEEPAEITVGEPCAVLLGMQLELEGKIIVDFFVEVPEEYAGAEVVMSTEDETTRVPVEDGEASSYGNAKIYKYYALSTQMRDTITLYVEKDGEKVPMKTSSGTDYTNGYEYTILKSLDNYKNSTDENLVNLANAMDTFGQYVQILVKHNEEGLTPPQLEEVPMEDLDTYASTRDADLTTLKYAGARLELNSDTTIWLYYQPAEGHTLNEYTFTVDNNEVTAEESGGYYILKIRNIKSNELGHMYSVKVTDGTNTQTLNYSALSYADSIIKKNSDVNNVNACKAIYWYYKMAVAYFDEV